MSQVEIPISAIGAKTNRPDNQSTVKKASAVVPTTAPTTASTDASATVSTTQRRIGVTTMGCKVNTYESELISETFKSDDWSVVSSKEVADMYIINTCTVTQEADRQARREVRKVVKINPEAVVVVTGCYAQIDAQACAEIPGVDLVVGNDRKLDIHNLLPQLASGSLPKVLVGDLDEHVSLPEQILTSYEAHTRAFVQIQQGCDQGCTFCIIHVARGPSRSLAPTLIKRQVEKLALNNYPEIVICGVDLGAYGEDFPNNAELEPYNLVSLLKELLALQIDSNADFRIRLSSVDPAHISDDLIDLIVNEPRMCPHLHLSLQSGSTLILKRMKRRYDREHVYERIQTLRQQVPNLVLSADVMVGFPTETEEQYLETEQAIIDLDIAFPHVFAYSERSGTPAARIPAAKQVPVAERKARSARLRNVAKSLQSTVLQDRIGTQAWVLPEKQGDDSCKARSEDYLNVLLKQTDVTLGQWLQVTYTDVIDNHLIATPV